MPNASLTFGFNHCRDCSATRRGFIFCHMCRTAKTVDAFYRDRRGRDRYHAGCKDCRREHANALYRERAGLRPPSPRRPRSGYHSPRAERIRIAMIETVCAAGPAGIGLKKLAAGIGVGRTWILQIVHEAIDKGQIVATREPDGFHAWILTAGPEA
jgi:hypothetical protein